MAVARLFLVIAAILALMPVSRAVIPDTGIADLEHTAWTIGDGAPPDIWALAEAPDGALLLGTGAGLYRFDGTVFERLTPADGNQYVSIDMTALHVSKSGDLWIGYSGGGVSLLREGGLTNFVEESGLPGGIVPRIIEGHDGEIFAVTFRGVYRFDGEVWAHLGQNWGYDHGPAVWAMVDDQGALWVNALDTILVLPRGETHFREVGKVFGRALLTKGPSGTLTFINDQTGLGRISISDQRIAFPYPSEVRDTDLFPNYVLTDRTGGVWFTDISRGGVFRISGEEAARFEGSSEDLFAQVDHFDLDEGLTSNIAVPILEDRAGNIWVGTNLGLNRFRPKAFVVASDIPATSRAGYQLAFSDTAEFIISTGTAWRLNDTGQLESWRSLPSLADSAITDSGGRLWIGGGDGLRRIGPSGETEPIALPEELDGTRIHMLREDDDKRIWASIARDGVFRLEGGLWTRMPLPDPLAGNWARASFLDSGNDIWAGFRRNAILRYSGDVPRPFTAADGLSIGDAGAFLEVDGRLLVGGEFGLARLEDGRFSTLTQETLPGAVGISGLAQTPDGMVWLNGIAGLVRVPARELDRAFAEPGYKAETDIFTTAHGLPGLAQQDGTAPTLALSRDGRLWIVTNHGVAWHDPSVFVERGHDFPATVRTLIVDGVSLAAENGVRLPAGAQRLGFRFGAINLSSAERMRFRYRLIGEDKRWADAGGSRIAQYSNLPPGRYAFEVIASDQAGTWPTSGETLTFVLPPTFFQSIWFALLCFTGLLGVLWLAYDFRLRQIAGRIRARMEARMFERERIARELHDTLLQGFQGLVLKFEGAVSNMPPTDPLRAQLGDALDRAEGILVEGRDRVSDLRGSTDPEPIARAMERIVEDIRQTDTPQIRIETLAAEQALHPVASREVLSIAREALTNAVHHAQATLVIVELSFAQREFRLSVRDDGCGIPEDIEQLGGREGHFGIQGMRERAEHLSGRLLVSRRAEGGTDIRLILPGSVAFANSRRHFGRRLGHGRELTGL